MYPLGLCSMVMWTLIIDRFLALSGVEKNGITKITTTEEANYIKSRLKKHLSLIAVLAGIAPLLGLLGTVNGMIETFNVISLFGTGNAKAMAGGISVAMVTTQSGLLVAIPGMLFSAMLFRRARRIENRIDEKTIILQRASSGGRL